MRLFSKRNDPKPDRYKYALEEKVRLRIFHTLRQHEASIGYFDFDRMLEDVGEQLLARRGSMHRLAGSQHMQSPALEHFFICSDEEAIDFLTCCFRTREIGMGDQGRRAVEVINRIFEEEGIGYEFTLPQMIDLGPATMFGRPSNGRSIRIEHPHAIRKDEAIVHENAVKPALTALADSRFATANQEMLKAFEEVQRGDYADAITSCGSAFESVLKTICDSKGWAYDPQRHTCSDLVEICRANNLFWPFYTQTFTGVGSIRNKLGDAHGQGPRPQFTATRAHAEHMISATCSHIVLLVGLAGI